MINERSVILVLVSIAVVAGSKVVHDEVSGDVQRELYSRKLFYDRNFPRAQYITDLYDKQGNVPGKLTGIIYPYNDIIYRIHITDEPDSLNFYEEYYPCLPNLSDKLKECDVAYLRDSEGAKRFEELFEDVKRRYEEQH